MYNLDIGVIIPLEELLEHGTKNLEELGLNVCQVNAWHVENLTKENAEKLLEITKGKIKISSLWVGWPGPRVWDFIEGPATLGLVPKEFRYVRGTGEASATNIYSEAYSQDMDFYELQKITQIYKESFEKSILVIPNDSPLLKYFYNMK
jgi:membrane protease subunit HflC